MSDALLATLLPVRDQRDRVVGYTFSSCPASPGASHDASAESRRSLELVSRMSRLAGRSLVVPVTPAVVREGAITRFASTDAIWLVATDGLDDPRTRSAVERLTGSGLHFALDGFPEGDPLPSVLGGSAIVLDAHRTSPSLLASRVRLLLEVGLRPLVRGVDDRATRRMVLGAGAHLHSGRLLARGAATVDRGLEASIERAIVMLAAFADGRPPNASFDADIENDPHLASAVLRMSGSAAVGVRGPRTVAHTMSMLGRDRVLEQLVVATARLMGEAAQDPELAFVALRRAGVCERLGAALDPPAHPRARAVAGLVSVLEFALGAPPAVLEARLELPPVLRDVLRARELPLGRLLDVVDAIDYGWWDDLRARCALLGISPLVVSEAQASAWRAARDELGLSRAEPT